MSRTLLALMVPEAESLVGDTRASLDPSARLGLGAHITLVYPWLDSTDVTDEALIRLRRTVARHAALSFELDRVDTFPSTVWLAPSPSEAIESLAASLEAAFQEKPRVGPDFERYVPHVSVARNVRKDRDNILAALHDRLHIHGPVECLCKDVHVMERDTAGWRVLASLPLGLPLPDR
jgi:2'-5' RNA ligase